jgi:hypothetical protein
VNDVVSSVIWRSASRHHCSSLRSNVTEPLAAAAESVVAAAAVAADDEDAAVACAAATSAAAPLTLAARELALLLALLLWLLMRRVLLVGGLTALVTAAAAAVCSGAGEGDGEGDAPKNQPNIIGKGGEGGQGREQGAVARTMTRRSNSSLSFGACLKGNFDQRQRENQHKSARTAYQPHGSVQVM